MPAVLGCVEELLEEGVDAGEEAVAGGVEHAEHEARHEFRLAGGNLCRDPFLVGGHVESDPVTTDVWGNAGAVTLRAIGPELTMLSVAERQLLDDWLERVVNNLSPQAT